MAFEISLKTLLRRKNYPEDQDTYSATPVVPSFASAVCTVNSTQGRRSTWAAILCSVCVDLPVLSPKSGNVMYFFT